MPTPDCVYIAACSTDARLTRICIASIRFFYPNIPIKILPGGKLERTLIKEIKTYWNVEVQPLTTREWGWGFVKLEPLFFTKRERFLILDSDTVLCGKIFENWEAAGDFLVDQEPQSDVDIKRIYYDWEHIEAETGCNERPEFVFNSGQWFGTSGILKRDDFERYVDWKQPTLRVKRPDIFKNGEQGILNYVMNQKAKYFGLRVERRRMMRWPGHNLSDLNVAQIASKLGPPVIVHWAGFKTAKLRNLPASEILEFFEDQYYSKLPWGKAKKVISAIKYPSAVAIRRLVTRVQKRIGS
jgi:hypothetical protein